MWEYGLSYAAAFGFYRQFLSKLLWQYGLSYAATFEFADNFG
ncbi:hypothetical protein HMPREF1981_02766 [Bacteroides pyogenes F0041]|uniref:Uncharacterized protein n=1 Tax=Bacteroides pyogenes F0041 TaxID=1321819 RepID=U2CBR2_9BACE|nr:hypothetical protein HMPREF1981_02766 [Bacteroides pyogenes F0041]